MPKPASATLSKLVAIVAAPIPPADVVLTKPSVTIAVLADARNVRRGPPIPTNAATARITFCTGPGNAENLSITVVNAVINFSTIGKTFVPTDSLRSASALSNFCVDVTFFSAASPYFACAASITSVKAS